MSDRECDNKIDELINMVPLNKYPHEMSVVQQKRVCISRALASMSNDDAKALISKIYKTDDLKEIADIYGSAIDNANESSVIMPIDYINDYCVFNTNKIKDYTFNTIPNYVDVSAIKLN